MGPRGRLLEAVRILVVEDCDDLCLLLQIALRDEGYSVDCASSAEDGVEMLNSGRYHLVLTDYALPGHSGAWLLSQVRHRRPDDRTPSLMITGDPDAPGIPHDVPVVKKPIDFDRLLRDIRRIVDDTKMAPTRNVSRTRHVHPGHMPSVPSNAPSSSAAS